MQEQGNRTSATDSLRASRRTTYKAALPDNRPCVLEVRQLRRIYDAFTSVVSRRRNLSVSAEDGVREISQHSSRIQKVLEDANLKSAAFFQCSRQSGRAILNALISGETDPQKLADLARSTARKKRAELVEALHGRIRDHHRRLLQVHLERVMALEQALIEVDAAVGKPWRRSKKATAC